MVGNNRTTRGSEVPLTVNMASRGSNDIWLLLMMTPARSPDVSVPVSQSCVATASSGSTSAGDGSLDDVDSVGINTAGVDGMSVVLLSTPTIC